MIKINLKCYIISSSLHISEYLVQTKWNPENTKSKPFQILKKYYYVKYAFEQILYC